MKMCAKIPILICFSLTIDPTSIGGVFHDLVPNRAVLAESPLSPGFRYGLNSPKWGIFVMSGPLSRALVVETSSFFDKNVGSDLYFQFLKPAH